MFVGQNLDADWAPDGRSIAYVSRRGEVPFSRRSMGLVVRSLSTGRERLFIPDADGVHDPRWAPDGVHILFNARTGNNDRLEILSTRDGMMRELSPAAPWFVPEWSGTGERLYGTVGRSGKFGIRVRDLASGHESELAWPVNMMFAVSHDERWLAMGLVGNDGAPAIGVRAAAGGEWRQAFRADPADRLFTIGWSPDDTTLFAWRRTGLGTEHVVTEIWSVSVANGVPGTPLRLGVVPGMNDARKFRLSPDGRELLFTAGSSRWLHLADARDPMSAFNLRCAGAVIVVLSAARPSVAQSLVLSRLSGTVRDRSGLPVTAVAVSARSPSLIGGARVVMTDQEGRYRLSALDPGEYEVRMSHDGFATAVYSRIRLTPGASVDVDGVLDVASVSERVNVMAPLVDVRTSASTQELDRPLLEHLPTSRDIYALINLTPGVSEGSGFGGTQGANALWVDGVDATETTTQTAWASFSYNWVEGVQVLAPGAPAEYGQFTGVGGSYALRSGSNRVSGLFEVLHPPSSWVAHNTPGDSPSGRSEAWDTSAQLGGPLREDRAWFFFGYHYSHIESRPPFYTGPGSTIFAHPDALLKLTASPGRTVRVDGFVEHGHSVLSADGLGINPLDGTQDINQPQTSWNLRATWTPGSRDIVDFRTGGYRSPQTFDPHPPATRSGPYPHYDEITGIESRNIQEYTEEGRRQQSLAVAWTRYMKAVGIGHELKLGFEYEHARLRSADHLPGDRLYIDDDGQPAYVNLWRGERQARLGESNEHLRPGRVAGQLERHDQRRGQARREPRIRPGPWNAALERSDCPAGGRGLGRHLQPSHRGPRALRPLLRGEHRAVCAPLGPVAGHAPIGRRHRGAGA